MAIIYDPNMDFSVIDASIPEDELETPSIDTALGTLFATFSSRGLHNKIIECRTTSAIKNTFGDDFGTFSKYGQVNLEALRAARSGARVFICSLLPEDAKVAYSLLGVTITQTNDIPVYMRSDTELSADKTSIVYIGQGPYVLDENNKKTQIRLKASASDSEATILATTAGIKLKVATKNFDPVTNSAYFDAKGAPTGYDGKPIVSNKTIYKDVVGEDGSVTQEVAGTVTETFYPLIMVHYYSRGKGGNFFAYRISRDTDRDKKIGDGRRYIIKFYELLSTGSYKPILGSDGYSFSFNKDAVFSDTDPTSEALSKVYKNLNAQSEDNVLQVIPYESSYEQLIKAIADSGASEESDSNLIDFVNGVFQNGNPYNKIVFDEESIDCANTLIRLDNGDDGSIDEATHTPEEIAKTKESMLIQFFNCDIDDDIFDEKITDIDILPDANYSDPVKIAIMSNFSVYRPDIFLAIDLGIVKSNKEMFSRYRELNSYVNSDYGYMCGIFGHAGYLNDPLVSASTEIVTGVYDYIGGLADSFSSPSGAFQMRAGANRGKVRYFTPFHVCKKNKANDIEKLEEYAINHIQYINKSKDMVWMLESSQYTVESSKLMSNRNAMVIGRLIRMCAGILPYYKYDERNISTTMEEAKATLENNVRFARIPSTIQVSFDMYQTALDVKTENAHCAIDVKFPNYIKKFHVVITARRQD